jgi:hypothetical protein
MNNNVQKLIDFIIIVHLLFNCDFYIISDNYEIFVQMKCPKLTSVSRIFVDRKI